MSLSSNFCQQETIFGWKPEKAGIQNSPDDIISLISRKENECDNNYDEQWTKLIFKIILSYENARKGENQAALSKIEECLNILQESPNEFISTHSKGLKHTLLASRISILGEVSTVDSLQSFADLDDVNKAVVYGLRSAVYLEYGPSCWKIALEFARKAKNLEDGEAEWHYLEGKVLFRSRRFENKLTPASNEELECFERAAQYSKENQPQYKVLLAETYRNAAKHYWKNEAAAKDHNTKAKSKFEAAFHCAGNCGNTYARCAEGFFKLPSEFRDYDKAKHCVIKALTLSRNNGLVNHVAGQYYEVVERNYEEAMRYYEVAKDKHIFTAYLAWINLKGKMDTLYDPLSDYEDMLDSFLEVKEQVQVRCLLGLHLLMLGDRQDDVMKQWKIAMDHSSSSPSLKNICLLYKGKTLELNILQMLYDVVYAALAKDTNNDKYQSLRSSIEAKYPDVNRQGSAVSPRDAVLARLNKGTNRQYNRMNVPSLTNSQDAVRSLPLTGSRAHRGSRAPTGAGSWRV